MLCCPERAEICQFLAQWAEQRTPHGLGKVKAHEPAAKRSGCIKALGNDRLDGMAKATARGANLVYPANLRFADAVLIQDSPGETIFDEGKAVTQLW